MYLPSFGLSSMVVALASLREEIQRSTPDRPVEAFTAIRQPRWARSSLYALSRGTNRKIVQQLPYSVSEGTKS